MFNYADISKAVFEGDADKTIELTRYALSLGYPAKSILEKGLINGINKVADKFQERSVLVPEVLLTTRALNAGILIVKPHMKNIIKKNSPKILIGTVAGDLHDIGKSLIRVVIEADGTQVIDLGVDVTIEKFIQAVRKQKPDILMMSALLTTTMDVMKEVIEELVAQGLRDKVKVMIGGAPITDIYAKKINADYYFKDVFSLKKFLDDNSNKLWGKVSRYN
ncbi:corrinoid protein [Desulfosporosinus sp. PR]|uniref:corrinoid protein n=1 Tax=Candidatus Desulfosporosinus nitrosoreducens TaxID=3401928 RepID=UPI0027EF8888|nr:corrinoid protein [Desulfosporosinus sp. PR]MDQ7095142.1 corrinoid protein [Desulfosporosinus sp. PR]